MDCDNSWDALLKPGDATTYFEGHQQREFNPNAEAYDSTNAWWLAEMCRLIYRQGAGEKMPSLGGLTRREVLEGVGLSEDFVQHDLAQCALISSRVGNGFRVIVFRGSHNLIDWMTNFNAKPITCSTGGNAHEGFQEALNAVWDRISALIENGSGPIFFTGHSLGAALATLAAARYQRPSQLYSFGSPLIGDEAFAGALRNVSSYRVVNNLDVVTTLPPALPPCENLRHIGKLHYITHEGNILVEPSPAEVASDRIKRDHKTFLGKNWRDLLDFKDAPERFADHAPVNYVAHLERALPELKSE